MARELRRRPVCILRIWCNAVVVIAEPADVGEGGYQNSGLPADRVVDLKQLVAGPSQCITLPTTGFTLSTTWSRTTTSTNEANGENKSAMGKLSNRSWNCFTDPDMLRAKQHVGHAYGQPGHADDAHGDWAEIRQQQSSTART